MKFSTRSIINFIDGFCYKINIHFHEFLYVKQEIFDVENIQ